MLIQDSVFLVTGGASGLGKATVEMLLTRGAYVTVLDLQAPNEDDIFNKYQERVFSLQVDITSEKEVSDAIDATKRKFGKLNGLINCAGIIDITGSPVYDEAKNEPHSLQKFTKIINVNLIGIFNVIRLAIPLLIENEPNSDGERGIIINTSSAAGHRGMPNFLAYSTSKAAVVAMTYTLTQELSKYGIRVLDIAPGVMETPMTDGYDFNEGITFPKRKGKPSEFSDFVKTIIENGLLNGASLKLDAGYDHKN